MAKDSRRLEIQGQATALEVYTQRGDLRGVRQTVRRMSNLLRDQERELETLENEGQRLKDRLTKLRHTHGLTVATYESSLMAFERFRSGISIVQRMDCFQELPDVLDQIRNLLKLSGIGLVLVQEDYADYLPLDVPTLPRETLERLLDEILPGAEPRQAFIGDCNVLRGQEKALGLETAIPIEAGSCFIQALRDKYDPGRRVGLLTLLDHTRDRYTQDKATDFLEHFCEILAWSLVTLRDHEKLDRERVIDPLTGVHNRAYLERHAPRVLDFAARKGFPVCLVFMDLNGFKTVNDTLGHEAGDQVLRNVAGRIRDLVRRYDVFVRLGGDEFVVLMPDTSEVNARSFVQRVHDSLGDLSVPACTGRPSDLRVSVAAGLTVFRPGLDLEDLLKAADQAMYTDKKEQGYR